MERRVEILLPKRHHGIGSEDENDEEGEAASAKRSKSLISFISQAHWHCK